MRSGIVRNLREMGTLAGDLLQVRYPRFVYGGPYDRAEIAVFTFHSVEPRAFESLLQFLSLGGYGSLKAGEVAAVVAGRRPPPKRPCVALTFDDGMGSVWAVAYPLLRRYGFTGTVFLISEWIREGGGTRLPNLDDVASGGARLEDVLDRESGEWPMITWAEARRMKDSGVLDFQSHSATHSLIPVKPEIVGFVSPQLLDRYQSFEFMQATGSAYPSDAQLPALGTPLYRSASRLSAKPCCVVPERVREACIRHVRDLGGRAYFARPDWEMQLSEAAERALGDRAAVSYETREEQGAAIRWELDTSRRTIQERLGCDEVTDLCYPWGQGSEIAIAASREAGFRSNLWGRTGRSFGNLPGGDPYRISRMGEDFAWLLPGSGRKSLASLIVRKLRRRAAQGSPYLTH